MQQVAAGGTFINLVDVVEFSTLLYNRYERDISEVVSTSAIEGTIFGIETKKKPRSRDPVKTVEILQTGWVVGREDSHWKRVSFPLKEIEPEENVIDVIMCQIINLVIPYQMHGQPKNEQEAYEIIAIEAMDNLINPSHIVKINPKLVIAVDIDDFKLKIVDDSGTIRMAVYTNKLAALKALEIP